MSKAELWRECKLKSLAFDKPYQLLTREELSKALATVNLSNELNVTNSFRTPTEEEMKIESVHEQVTNVNEQDSTLKTDYKLVSPSRSQKAIDREYAIEQANSKKTRKHTVLRLLTKICERP